MIFRFFNIPDAHFKPCPAVLTFRDKYLHSLPSHFSLQSIRKPSNNRGYTLIELILVIVLLGLVFSITVPRFRQALLSDSLDSTTLRLMGYVQDLREKAVSGHVSYNLHIDIREKRLWAVAGNASEEEKDTAREKAFELPADVTIQDVWSWSSGKFYNEGIIRFSRKGYVEKSMIHLQSEDGREISLELTPFLGSIKIHEGYVDLVRG